ncbi:NAC domain-containing protein 83 [Cajanus cajan]|uniref:NAC domain-containing protein 29 n=1 Tax=Cajanus cajan TaxID=3821 RepID=A0A151S4E2_CAJCA|nr:NAC domain-containing protein 83 [Cajanus cajan]KYP49676.1 NAC domain-containing protein 29 [Cajanus cajan]
MERLNFIKNGMSRLPPGFRFQPTDEELVFQYLKCKIFSCQLPASIIPEINVSKYDPWDFPGNCDEQERYFFSSKETKYRNGNRMNRTTNSGYWKATGSDKKISSSISNNGIAGVRKTLVFYEGKSPNGSRTDWVMHEYRLVSLESDASNSSQNYANEIGDWVLCRMSMKKRSKESGDNSTAPRKNNTMRNSVQVDQPRFFDFLSVQNSAPAPIHSSTSSSSSSSNNFVEVSSPNHEETSGYADF